MKKSFNFRIDFGYHFRSILGSCWRHFGTLLGSNFQSIVDGLPPLPPRSDHEIQRLTAEDMLDNACGARPVVTAGVVDPAAHP